ncbi:MAG TPA: response regulator [Candidatus Limnocylindria bacterium]|jgi:DNA-binding response OmpR family regulator
MDPTSVRYRDVLVVEDERPLRRIIRRNLERRGVTVREAATAAEGLDAIRERAPDLLLLDINLPDRTGWELLRALRLEGPIPTTAVISAVRITPERLLEFGVVGYLPKPFLIESLMRLVLGHEVPA